MYTESDLEKEREKARQIAIADYEEKLEQAKEKARLEAIAAYEEKLASAQAELAAKNAQLEQLKQQLQIATTSTELLTQKEAEIAEHKAQIELLKKQLLAALQDTPAPQTPSTAKLRIDDLSVVSPTNPISTIYRDSTPPTPPIEIASPRPSAVYQNDWDSKKFQLSLVTARNEQTAKTSRQNNARPSTFSVKKGFGRG
ncbi:MAG: DUF1090 domain-containing protein [Hydrococcus sp. RU_2_2]|nr:DUF1090 domain-containing protein [Hydrococcus sp. RU_2_2]